jgi:hypothetical protein
MEKLPDITNQIVEVMEHFLPTTVAIERDIGSKSPHLQYLKDGHPRAMQLAEEWLNSQHAEAQIIFERRFRKDANP